MRTISHLSLNNIQRLHLRLYRPIGVTPIHTKLTKLDIKLDTISSSMTGFEVRLYGINGVTPIHTKPTKLDIKT